jgi:hypothetical protein
VSDDHVNEHLNASSLIWWAQQVGAEEYGFYVVIGGARMVFPLSLTADETGPSSESLPEPETPPL